MPNFGIGSNQAKAPFNGTALNRKSGLARQLMLAYPIFNDRRTDVIRDYGPLQQTGTVNGAPAKAITGFFQEAFHLVTASSQWIQVGGNTRLNSLRPLTFSMWVNFDNYPGAGAREIFSKGSNTYFFFRQVSGPAIQLDIIYSTTNLQVKTAAPNADGLWHHLLVTWDGTATAANIGIYWDGVALAHTTDTNGVGTVGADSGAVTAANGWGIGAFAGTPTNFLSSYVTLFSLWNRVLTAAERYELRMDPWALYVRQSGFTQNLRDSSLIRFVPPEFISYTDTQIPQLLPQ